MAQTGHRRRDGKIRKQVLVLLDVDVADALAAQAARLNISNSELVEQSLRHQVLDPVTELPHWAAAVGLPQEPAAAGVQERLIA